jgi:hypothetical protein
VTKSNKAQRARENNPKQKEARRPHQKEKENIKKNEKTLGPCSHCQLKKNRTAGQRTTKNQPEAPKHA